MKIALVTVGALVGSVLVFAMGLGVGITGTEASSAKAETVVKEVEVPGPTKTVTETDTVTKEVEVTPEACLVALREAERIGGHAAEFADITMGMTKLIPQAYEAGGLAALGSDVYSERVITKIDNQTAKINGLNGRLEITVDKYVTAAIECRSN